MGNAVRHLQIARLLGKKWLGALFALQMLLATSLVQGADVAGLQQVPLSLVNLSSHELSVENCQPLMDTAEYGRTARFKLISDLAEPLHIFSVTNTGRIRYRKTVLPGYDHSIFVRVGTALVLIEKNSAACIYRGRVGIEDNQQKYFVSELVAHYERWK